VEIMETASATAKITKNRNTESNTQDLHIRGTRTDTTICERVNIKDEVTRIAE